MQGFFEGDRSSNSEFENGTPDALKTLAIKYSKPVKVHSKPTQSPSKLIQRPPPPSEFLLGSPTHPNFFGKKIHEISRSYIVYKEISYDSKRILQRNTQ